jgi:hypothetical protein
MTFDLWPTTQEFLEAFSEEVAGAGGKVTDTYQDEGRLFARAVLPTPREVAPGDKLQGGVALRATEQDVRIHPYVFRQVCRNGAISAESVQTRIVAREDAFDVLPQVRDAVRECCGDEAFALATSQMRAARDAEADLSLNLMPMLSKLPRADAKRIVDDILGRFRRDKDRSQFGLMNAVTATARDTRDPELRWRLEELGGGIAARLRPGARPGGGEAVAPKRSAQPDQLVGV